MPLIATGWKQSKYATANQLTLMVRAYNHNLIQQLFLKVLRFIDLAVSLQYYYVNKQKQGTEQCMWHITSNARIKREASFAYVLKVSEGNIKNWYW